MAAKKRQTDTSRPERHDAGDPRGMRTPEAEHGEPAGATATMEREKKAMSPVPGARAQRHAHAASGHATCEVCGNQYDKCFQVTSADRTMTFDSFECAIQAMAPTCAHCDCRIIGHGVEKEDAIYCCVHCAKESGDHELKDRA
jgi:hypothetical protein